MCHFYKAGTHIYKSLMMNNKVTNNKLVLTYTQKVIPVSKTTQKLKRLRLVQMNYFFIKRLKQHVDQLR